MQEPIFQRRMVSQNCVAPINLRAVFSYTITRLDQEGGRIKESPTSQMKTSVISRRATATSRANAATTCCMLRCRASGYCTPNPQPDAIEEARLTTP